MFMFSDFSVYFSCVSMYIYVIYYMLNAFQRNFIKWFLKLILRILFCGKFQDIVMQDLQHFYCPASSPLSLSKSLSLPLTQAVL